jgi:peptide/nickel transport system substrate-binding protein
MKNRVRSVRRGVRGAALLALVALVVVVAAQTAPAARLAKSQAAHPCLVMTGSGDPAFVRNFNPYTAQTLPSGSFVRGAFYEPLMITTAAGGGRQYPWLARRWSWSNGNKTLTLQLQPNVKWSDGTPLTAADVVYSLTAGKQNKVMDVIGLYRPGTNIASVKQVGTTRVQINLKTPDSQFIAANLNLQYIVPKHVFSKVKNVATWTNPDPVGSGPFTQIERFTTQDYVLNKNPNYWMKGAPRIPCVEYVQASSNDAALLLIQSGKVDWTHNFVPNVEKAYISKDPKHFHATATRRRPTRSASTASSRSGSPTRR